MFGSKLSRYTSCFLLGAYSAVLVACSVNKNDSAYEVCDEYGNRHASEEEAAAQGLEPAQYGATYCPEYKPHLN